MIIHEPLGIEHPYEQGPQERAPRHPIAGEPVLLGAVIAPGMAADQVWATWRVAGDPTTHEAAGIQRGDHWQVELPAFEVGQRVIYRLHGDGPDGAADTPEFSFDVLGWQRPRGVARLERTASGLAIWFDFDDPAFAPLCCRLDIEEGGHLRLHASATDAGPDRDAAHRVVVEQPGHLSLAGAGFELEVQATPYRLEIRREDGRPIVSQSTMPEWLFFPGHLPTAARLTFDSPADERFYGFGERFNALNQRGAQLDSLVYEQYKNQGTRTYIPMPWFLSSRGYGFYLETARRASFDLAASEPGVWQVEVATSAGALTAHIFAGNGPAENLRAFSRLTGQAQLPPDWVFGPWMSGNEWNTQAEVMRQVDLTRDYDIPATVMVIEAWSDETTFYIWNGAQYEPRPGDQAFHYGDFTFPADGPWPDPKRMVEELHRRGIRLILWQIPVLKKMDEPHPQHDPDQLTALERGFVLRDDSGRPYRVRPLWFNDALLLDPSNPAAQDWWLAKRAYLLDDLGIDGFKTDGGEHLWADDVVMNNGARGDEAINLYPNLYVGMYHRLMRERRRPPMTFSRAGYVGAQSFPCHWAGDENSTWPAFRATLLAGLNAGLSGIIFWGWDIGGFSGEIPGAELYLRGTAMATFCPIMQYHSELNNHQLPSRDRTPWNIAERTGHPEVIDIYREFAHLRMRLLPYLKAEALYCVESGEPLMRPLFLDWPDDPITWELYDQYTFGRSLLVAPVLEPGASGRRVYLPAGDWLDFWSDEPVRGGQWIDVEAALDRIPVFRRAGAPWPIQSPGQSRARR